VKEKNGKYKTEFGDIEKGILQDGMNLKSENNLIAVGGESQPSLHGVESFGLKLSEYLGKEIGGANFSNDGSGNTTHVGIGFYKDNSYKETKSNEFNPGSYRLSPTEVMKLTLVGHWHTHPKDGIKFVKERIEPSENDLIFKRNFPPSVKSYLITAPEKYGDPYPLKIPY
jgi:hypothetical protein